MEPFLSERVDIAGAVVATTIANVNKGKGAKAFSIDDFLLIKNRLRAEEAKNTPTEEQEAVQLQAFILSMGGRLQ